MHVLKIRLFTIHYLLYLFQYTARLEKAKNHDRIAC